MHGSKYVENITCQAEMQAKNKTKHFSSIVLSLKGFYPDLTKIQRNR